MPRAADPRLLPPGWEPPIADRVRKVYADDAHKLVYFYEVPDSSTFRYRVFNMVEALDAAASRGVSATYFTRSELPVLERLVGAVDTLVICRSRYTTQLDGLVARARASGCRVLFDTDDLVFDTRYVPLLLETHDRDPDEKLWDEWFAYIARMGSMLRRCEGAITTNQFLADRIIEFAPMPTWVVPNFLNTAQLRVAETVRRARPATSDDAPVTSIGYFSGTPTHNRDFEIASGALARLMTRHPRVRLRIVGFLDIGAELRALDDRIDILPLTDLLDLEKVIGSTDLNIVPLQSNIFTDSKSELKYFEAAIVNTPTLASPTYAYRSAIDDGHNGYLVDAYDWEGRLEQAVAGDLDLAGVRQRGLEHVQATYAPAAQVDAICAAVLGR